jgi:hypothetical protein
MIVTSACTPPRLQGRKDRQVSRDTVPAASVDEHRIVLNRAGSIALSLISLRKELEIRSGGELSDLAADNLLNVCQVLGFAEPMIRFVLGEANL